MLLPLYLSKIAGKNAYEKAAWTSNLDLAKSISMSFLGYKFNTFDLVILFSFESFFSHLSRFATRAPSFLLCRLEQSSVRYVFFSPVSLRLKKKIDFVVFFYCYCLVFALFKNLSQWKCLKLLLVLKLASA
jgi:hypothetical protein